jgi:aspartate aminotransferase-like enzyme
MAPVPLAEAIESIKAEKPSAVFLPHVETATGILFPDDYIKVCLSLSLSLSVSLC